MITTTTDINARFVKLNINGGSLLAQVTSNLGAARYLAGKQAYDYLGDVQKRPAGEIKECLSFLGLTSIGQRNLNDQAEAALAVAASAILDSSRGVRCTATEQVERAMSLLDDELAAGW